MSELETDTPHPAALLIAMALVTRNHLRLTYDEDARLGDLAGQYELGLAAWTGKQSVFVGFYRPPEDPRVAGEDLAQRCFEARQWGARRLQEQGAQRTDVVLVALGNIEGELSVPADEGRVQVGAVAVSLETGQARNVLPSPSGLPDAKFVSSAVRGVLGGQPGPTLAAVGLAENQTVAGAYAQPATRATHQVPIVTYTLIGIWVAMWLAEVAITGQTVSGGYVYSSHPVVDAAAFSTAQLDWWRFLSSAFVHDSSNPLHLLFNSFFMWNIGRYVEMMYGRLALLGVFAFSALAGSLFVLLGDDLGLTHTGAALGASGGLCGFLTLFLMLGIREGRNVPVGVRDSLRRNMGSNVIFILVYSFALSHTIAVGAHVGGFVGGALAGLVLPPLARIGGRDLRVWEKAVIYALTAAMVASVIAALIASPTFSLPQ